MSAAERLSNVCSSVCCSQTPLVDPSACADMLLLKYETRESLLLQLSTIRCLYNASGHRIQPLDTQIEAKFANFSLKTTHFFTQNLARLFILLSEYLQSADQYVCYCASKALVSVLIHTRVKAYIVTDIFTKLDTQIDTHVGVYCLQTIREVLKLLRKNIITTTVFKNQLMQSTSECLHTIAHNKYWSKTLQLFISKHFHSSRIDQNLQSTFTEFLSLTVELLRHHKQEECSAEVATGLFRCIAASLSDILTLVDRFEDIFIVKRFIDVALKIEKVAGSEEIVHFLSHAVIVLLGLQMSKKIVQCWVRERGKLLLTTPENDKSALDYKQIELVCISVRKTVLLVMKCIASLLVIHSPQATSNEHTLLALDVLCGVLSSLCQLFSSCVTLDCSNTQQCTCILYEIVSEEDGCLVHALQTSNSILRHTLQSSIVASVPGLNTFVAITNPHYLWLCFLLRVNFDHSFLLDLLLSPEINFNTALHDYLILVASHWKSFKEMCSSVEPCKLVHSNQPIDWTRTRCVDETKHEATISLTRKDCRPRRLVKDSESEAHPLSMSTSVEKTTTGLVDYSCSSSSEDEDTTASKIDHSVARVDKPTHFELQVTSSDKTQPLSKYLGQELPFSSTTSIMVATESQSSNLEDTCTPMTVPESSSPSLSSSSLPPDSLLGHVIDCIIRLRMCLERLSESGLIQFTHTSCCELVTAVESIEKLYEAEET